MSEESHMEMHSIKSSPLNNCVTPDTVELHVFIHIEKDKRTDTRGCAVNAIVNGSELEIGELSSNFGRVRTKTISHKYPWYTHESISTMVK